MTVQSNMTEALLKGLVKVVFTKVDGSIREGIFTTDLSIIPEDMHPKNSVVNAEVTAVYDVEADGWRSFRNDSVISWSTDV